MKAKSGLRTRPMLLKCLILLHNEILKTQMKGYASFQNSVLMHMLSKCQIKMSGSLTHLKVVTNEKGEAVGEVLTIIC